MTTQRDEYDQDVKNTLQLLDEFFGPLGAKQVTVRLWNGVVWQDDSPRPATLILKHPGALRNMFLKGTEVALAEAYLFDDFDIEGDIESVFVLVDQLNDKTLGWRKKLRSVNQLLQLPNINRRTTSQRGPAHPSGKKHSISRDRQAVTYHYDVSNEFYALWLDKHMVYSCAYFNTGEEDLDTAQEQKMDHICQKLRLKPGQRLLDIGCGWGGLVMFAAQKYGVDAVGITLSEPQAKLANERISAVGLSDHCRVELRDYRELIDREGYDALVSIGMFEHVGADLLPTYFDKAWTLLKPRGVFLNHGIANTATEKPVAHPTFSEAYVFPDGELTPISISLQAAEKSGFEVRDVENLREHYVLTLRHWVKRLEAHHEDALLYVDEPTYRVWRLYMSGSAYGFAHSKTNLFQTLLVKPDRNGQSGLPLTRSDWYQRR